MHSNTFNSIVKTLLLTGICLSLTAFSAGCSSLFPKEEDALTVPLVTPVPVEYKTQKAELSSISNEVTMSGKIVAATEQDLYFTCAQGRLKEMLVSSGDKVKAGDILATIETDDLDVQIAMQELEVDKAQIQYNSAGGAADIDLQIAVQELEVDKAQILFDSAGEQSDLDLKISLQQLEVNKAQILYNTTDGGLDLDLQIALQKLEENSAEIMYAASAGTSGIDSQIELQKLNIEEAQTKYDAAADGSTEKTLAGIYLEQAQIQLASLNAQKANNTAANVYDRSLAYNNMKQQQLKLAALTAQKDSSSGTADKTVAAYNLKQQQIQLDALNAQKSSPTVESDKKLAGDNLKQQQLQLDELQKRKDGTSNSSEKSLAEINLKQQQIQLDVLKKQKEGTTITAPFDGQISYTSKTKIGDTVAGYETIVTICDPTTLLIATNDQLAVGFSVGGDAQITLKNDTVLQASVIETPATIDENSEYAGYSFLEFTGSVPDGVKYAAVVTIDYVTEKKDNTIVIPKKYVVSASNRKYVVVLENGLRVEKDVTIGITNTTDAEILTGLNAGDLYILN